MPRFEVFIPAVDADGFNITAQINAETWIAALRSGLAKLGDTADIRNVMVDIKETSIDVTEPQSGRVFRIRELDDAAPAATPAATLPRAPMFAGAAAKADAVASAPPPAAASAPPEVTKAAPTPAKTGAPPAATKQTAPRFTNTNVEETVTRERPNDTPHKETAIGRGGDVGQLEATEDLIGELFEMTQGLYDTTDLLSASDFLLKLAMSSVPADSGAVFISDINTNDLYFGAAAGPKAQEVMKFRVPMGQGIVGFVAQEGVSLAVSEVQRDPRFYAAISKSIGYETRSIICAPVQKEGRVFGALELINKIKGSSFTQNEISILNFLAHEFADYLVNTGQTGD